MSLWDDTPLPKVSEIVSDPELKREARELEQELQRLEAEQQEREQRARELMEREARGEGTFAREIFELKREKMMLATQAQYIRVRLKYILWDGQVK